MIPNIKYLAIIILCMSLKTFAQVTTPNNNGTGTDFVGWDNLQGFDLNIEHKGSQNINFWTNGFQRATILSGGNVGIGIASPNYLLHIDAGKFQITNGTSTGSTNGFLLGLNGSNVELNQQENFDMNFFTNATQRMTILRGGEVGMGTAAPATNLHINNPAGNPAILRLTVSGSSGNSFDIGTDVNGTSYLRARPATGHIQFFSNTVERGRFWGNRDFWAFGASQSASFLPNTGPLSLLTLVENGLTTEVWQQWVNLALTDSTQTTDGLRIGIVPATTGGVGAVGEIRQNETQPLNIYTSYATSTTGSMTIGSNKLTGIGDFTSTVTAPARRLEVFDSGNNPQMRITKTLGSVYTDFETNSSGYLKVNPTGRYTGFDLSGAPANVVDINSTSSTISGLRLRNLSTVSTSNGKVLSIDPTTNDVILVNDLNGSPTYCGTNNIMARFSSGVVTFDCSNIFNDFNNKIGLFTTSPAYRIQAEGTSLFTTSAITSAFGLHPNASSLLPPTVMVNSDGDEGLSILNSTTTNYKDMLQIYGDNNTQYHFRTRGTSGSARVTFDHEPVPVTGPVINTSWLGYNTSNKITTIKDDFATTPAITASGFGAHLTYDGQSSKLYVEAQSTTGDQRYGLAVNNSRVETTPTSLMGGILGYVESLRTGEGITNYGGRFFATGAAGANDVFAQNIAVEGHVHSMGALSQNYGGQFYTHDEGHDNIGILARAEDGTNTTYGMYAYAPIGSCATGSCAAAAGFFNGAVYTTNSVYFTSDATLKTNILPYEGDNLLRQIPVHTFDYLTQNNFDLNLQEGNHFGVIAQEVELVLPNLIKVFKQPELKDAAGNILNQAKDIKAVNYNEFIPLLIAAYQKQANTIDSLLGTMQPAARLAKTTSNNGGQLTVELENINAIVLNQNEPNPFAEQTTITWNIPVVDNGVLNAMLMFYDNTGTIIKTVKINETGAGSLLVYGSKLSTGIYTYSLVVNNKTIDSKKMMKTK